MHSAFLGWAYHIMHSAFCQERIIDRDIAAIRNQLDEATLAAAYAEGWAMTIEQAMACALIPAVVG